MSNQTRLSHIEYREERVLYAVYDLTVSPETFDIGNFLCHAEIKRIEMGLDYFKVIFLRVAEGKQRAGQVHSESAQLYRLFNVLIPACRIHPSCIGYVLCADRSDAAPILAKAGARVIPSDYTIETPTGIYSWKWTWRLFNEGHYVTTLRARREAREEVGNWLKNQVAGKKVVTVTLRECSYEQPRNSDIGSWSRFLNSLDDRQFAKIVIRDHVTAFDELPAFFKNVQTCSIASWNLEFRLALYELSYISMFVNNGPWVLGLYDDNVNSIMVKLITEAVLVTSTEFRRRQGDPIDSKYRFLGDHQHLCWDTDTVSNLNKYFSLADVTNRLIDEGLDPRTHLSDSSPQSNTIRIEASQLTEEDASFHDTTGAFCGTAYLKRFPAVSEEIADGRFSSAHEHFLKIGRKQNWMRTETLKLDLDHRCTTHASSVAAPDAREAGKPQLSEAASSEDRLLVNVRVGLNPSVLGAIYCALQIETIRSETDKGEVILNICTEPENVYSSWPFNNEILPIFTRLSCHVRGINFSHTPNEAEEIDAWWAQGSAETFACEAVRETDRFEQARQLNSFPSLQPTAEALALASKWEARKLDGKPYIVLSIDDTCEVDVTRLMLELFDLGANRARFLILDRDNVLDEETLFWDDRVVLCHEALYNVELRAALHRGSALNVALGTDLSLLSLALAESKTLVVRHQDVMIFSATVFDRNEPTRYSSVRQLAKVVLSCAGV
ncbi:hypothetical protein FIV00_27935 [Labrenzia sp. THAF82]|uniref:hypothetical protein n=1 Tax=Labrenzia sp. THAF82 TaxID=2587861 RepID=UPI0012683306|nr:hypothetical protein [Labrenzia sp. THAF82]QFT34357.1 hypothetical protein FIV00_27935 [Labrenzia sp. THAF82]